MNEAREKVREPYMREELEAIYDAHIEAQAKQWGELNIYTKWARDVKTKRLAEFDAGNVVSVCKREYHAHGMDYADNYYSDGTMDTVCYGYAD